jgi:hypothetical protein
MKLSEIINIALELYQQVMMLSKLFEMDAYNDILAYLLDKNITLGDYDLDDLYINYDNKYIVN